MKKINLILSICIIFLIALSLYGSDSVKGISCYEYGRIRLNENNYNIRWENGNSIYNSNLKASGNNESNYANNCQNIIIQLGGNYENVGQVRNIVGVFDFLGAQGWELIEIIDKNNYETIYIFKRQI